MVHVVCNCARQFNVSLVHIKRVGLHKSGGFSIDLLFVECKLILPKFRTFYVEMT